jgi:diaminopimelate decarboxylase
VEPFTYIADRLHCEAVAATRLVAEYGTPLYVYSAGAMRGRLQEFAQAFGELRPLLAYSVKSNGNLAVLRLLAELGAGADIVSGGERSGAAGGDSGRASCSAGGEDRHRAGGSAAGRIYAFNVESGELHALNELAVTMGQRARIALRVNPDVLSPTPHHYTATGHGTTKFGIPFAEARALYRQAGTLSGVEVRGVEVHIGSQILEVEPYRRAVLRVLQLTDELRADGHELEFLDLGGGFGVSYDDEVGPAPADFANALIPDLRRAGPA